MGLGSPSGGEDRRASADELAWPGAGRWRRGSKPAAKPLAAGGVFPCVFGSRSAAVGLEQTGLVAAAGRGGFR